MPGRDGERARDAAEALKITAQDLAELRLIDGIVPEPLGGAHREPETAIAAVDVAIDEALRAMDGMDGPALVAQRRDKFLNLGNAGWA